jgi:hypothetical protein
MLQGQGKKALRRFEESSLLSRLQSARRCGPGRVVEAVEVEGEPRQIDSAFRKESIEGHVFVFGRRAARRRFGLHGESPPVLWNA